MADKTKTVKSRIIHKHDTAANWLKGASFVPKQGEIIVYDIDADHDYERFKIGDGKTAVNSLPFAGGDVAASTLEDAKAYTDAEIAEWVGDKTVAAQVQTAMATKADTDHTHDNRYYTESEINTKLAAKSDATHTHDLSNASVNYAATAGVASEVAWGNVTGKPNTYNPATHKHDLGDVNDLQTALNGKVPTSRKVNGKALTSDITLSASDVSADAAGSANTALTNAKKYTDAEILEWVGDKTVSVQIGNAIDDAVEYLEGEIVDPVFYVTFTKKSDGTYSADKTYADVEAAYIAGQSVVGISALGTGTLYHLPLSYYVEDYAITFQIDIEGSVPTTIAYGADSTIVVKTYDKLASTTDVSDAISKIAHPVTSVNNQTGAVKLTASIIGADVSGSASSALTSAKSYTDAEIKEWVGDKTVSTQISTAIASKADSDHTHDDRYYTETEINSKLNEKLSLSGGTLTGNLTLDNSATGHSGKPYVQWAAVGGNKPYTGLAHDQSDGTFIICSMEKDTTTHGEKYYKNGLAIGGGSGNLFWKGSKIVTVDDAATTSIAGLMSASDKKKLDGIATGATKVAVDSELSSTSTNPVQNKIVNDAIADLKTKVGDTAVATQISNAIASKADSSHTHDGRYYTESEIDTKLNGKANSSHGNHVPTAETANNAKFLRNDNTWQTVTPDNIGAAKASHGTHVSYSSTAPVMDGTASVGSASTVARSDHKHPTDTSRASASEVSALKTLVGDVAVATQISNAVAGKSNTGHKHVVADITNIVISATEPSSPTTGMLWFDIS